MLLSIKIFLLSLLFIFSFYSQVKAEELPSEILLFDNFEENNLDKWEIKAGQWYIENNILIGNHVGTHGDGVISTGNYNWNNYIVEFDINSYLGIDDSIYFRESGNGNAYIFNFRHGTGSFGTPEIKFFRQFNHTPTLISSVNDLMLNNEKWYHVKLVAYNDNIKLYVNNIKYFDYNDPGTTIKNGKVTFTYWTGEFGFAKVGIDNVRILSLNPTIPFLDLPWDYSGNGLSFNEAALAINSFFDHEYPLLSRGKDLSEPATAIPTVIDYLGRTTNNPYTKHDGYDYGKTAKANLGNPVLAAASGTATYINSCSSCGNMIVIDHQNGYQTRYMHLLKDDLITNIPNQPVPVNIHQTIGKVGFSGNVWPNDERGAHIHFGVFQDKNGDGNFNDNEPDGVTDPFGWQSESPDPWENYTFNYLGQNRIGNKSYYLWKNNLANMVQTITPSGATANVGNFTVTFPPNSTDKNIIVDAKSAPIVKPSDNLTSLGSTLLVKVTDTLGNPVTTLQNLFDIILDFSSLDLSKLKTDTLAFYSSPDGVNWTKEDTSFPTQTSAKTSINHLSYFALLGERKDAIPPTTTAAFSGQLGQPSWFRSDVKLTLNTQDNDGGLGVDYTLYKINEGEIQLYNSPLNFTDEGHYKVEFYSADKDDNIEDDKSVEFDIDKTSPEAKIYFDDTKSDLSIIGMDTNQTIVSTENIDKDDEEDNDSSKKIYKITDQAGNTLELNIKGLDKNEENDSKNYSLRFYSLKYNGQNPIILPSNKYLVEYNTHSKKLEKLLQRFKMKDKDKIKIRYNAKLDKSEIYTFDDEKEKLKEIRSGLVILTLTTKNGHLEYSY